MRPEMRPDRAAAASTAKRRGRPSTKHAADPAVSDRLYDAAETEYLAAVAAWQERTGQRFPRATDYLAILRDLGYRKFE